jgi:hypothetical protein
MSFNGSGTHNLVHDWTTDLAGAVPVTASRMDAQHGDISTALSTTICRDGQSTTTARIPFAAGTSAAAGTTASVAYSQTNDNNTGLYFPATDQWGLVAGGVATITSTATKVTLPVAVDFTGAAAPTSSDGAALGSTTQMWSDLFLASGAVINFNNGNATMTHAAGSLTTAVTTFAITGALTVSTTAAITGNATFGGTVAITSTLAAGATTVTGALAASGDFAIATNKFTVASASGNAAVAGTLAVTGASTFTGLMTGRIPLLHVRDEKADNTDGGTFTSGAWRTRTLNTEVTNEISGASLAANQITLPAGTYEIEATAPGWNCGDHKTKLCNITDTADTIVGTTESAGAANNSNGRSLVRGRFTIAGAKVFELQHRCSTTAATTGFGQGAGFGVVEVYAEVLIRKVA